MTEPSTSLSSVRADPSGRLLGVDAVRAVAILGMFYVHVAPTGWLYPGARSEAPPVLVWLDEQFSSRSMSLFVLLAGVSVALMTGGRTPYTGVRMATARRRIVVRAALLLLIGLALDSFVDGRTAGSVLQNYAVLMVLLLTVTRLRARLLFGLSAVFALASPLFVFWVTTTHLEWMRMDAPNGLAVLARPDQLGATAMNLLVTGGGFQTVYGIPLVLAGLAIGRLDLRAPAVRARMLVTGAGLAATTYVLQRLAWDLWDGGAAVERAMEGDGPPQSPWQALMGMSTDTIYAVSVPAPVFMIGIALALLGGFLVLLERRRPRRVLAPLRAMGALSLTWYAGHLVALALLDDQPYPFLLFAGFAATALAFSVAWLRFARRGPLEWLLHRAIITAVPVRS